MKTQSEEANKEKDSECTVLFAAMFDLPTRGRSEHSSTGNGGPTSQGGVLKSSSALL